MSGENISAARFLTYDSSDIFYEVSGDEPAIQFDNISEIRIAYERIQEWETKLTPEERNSRNDKAWRLLPVIKSEECWNYLRCIYRGRHLSIRHEMFMTHTREKRENLKRISGMSVFHDHNATRQLMTVLEEYHSKLRKHANCKDYMYYVMLPEAIIFAIQLVDNVSKEEAIKTYLETSKEC